MLLNRTIKSLESERSMDFEAFLGVSLWFKRPLKIKLITTIERSSEYIGRALIASLWLAIGLIRLAVS